ncbi:cupin domain-containing protein [Pendulispora brunnea]|uniref:Cupin domain-containing protein n=1 Tax=Pendulispora brunnea TaxID=2905690 RepID=A0ABZ2K678_9BACT
MSAIQTGTSFHIATTLANMAERAQPHVLGDYAVDGKAMLGVIRIPRERTGGFWERHDGGDEILVLLEGRCTMTLRPSEGPEKSHELGPGDALLIPKGVAHSGKAHTPEVRVLFITPREGNVEWHDDPARNNVTGHP